MKYGEYIRTKLGEIAKIVDTNMFDKTIYKDKQDAIYYLDEIVNHSKNIIDLIQVGDYVNGSEVVTVYGYDGDGNDRDDKGIIEVDDDYAYGVYLEDVNIFSVLTKEMYEQNCFKVVE